MWQWWCWLLSWASRSDSQAAREGDQAASGRSPGTAAAAAAVAVRAAVRAVLARDSYAEGAGRRAVSPAPVKGALQRRWRPAGSVQRHDEGSAETSAPAVAVCSVAAMTAGPAPTACMPERVGVRQVAV
jgi:hypothetical protein